MENLVIDPLFWKDRKVFITGHTGFKGSWLSLWLKDLGAHVTGYALSPTTEQALYTQASVNHSLVHSTFADICDLETFKKEMQAAEPSIVVHLAAQPLVINSYLDPINTYSTNVMGTVNMFEAVRSTSSVKAVLNITTDKCYENKEHLEGYEETDPMGGYDPYSASKGCSELITASYRKAFFNDSPMAIASARAGNVIGGGDWAKNRIIPDAMRAFANNEKLLVRNPNSIRPWQHVLEPLFGYLILCQQLINNPTTFSGAWNFGPNYEDTQPVSVLADIIVESWGGNAEWGHDNEEHPHEANYLKLDCSKAKNILKWNPVWSLDQALVETVKWYKASCNNEDMRKFTLNQIEKYTLHESAL
jgi:CDP-glucose 4,6-dehydratase